MPLDPGLLETTRGLMGALDAREAALQAARAEVRKAIRALHAAGASMREISAALGLSHQRVHQLIGGASQPEPPAAAECALCGEPGAGSRGICAGCREAARRLIDGEAAGGETGLRPAFRHHRRRCSACGRLPEAGERFAQGARAALCGPCLAAEPERGVS
jgi:hypothetical protein